MVLGWSFIGMRRDVELVTVTNSNMGRCQTLRFVKVHCTSTLECSKIGFSISNVFGYRIYSLESYPGRSNLIAYQELLLSVAKSALTGQGHC